MLFRIPEPVVSVHDHSGAADYEDDGLEDGLSARGRRQLL